MSGLNALIILEIVVSAIGLLYSVRLVERANDALRWLRANGMNGYREIAARGAIHRGYVRVGVFACMVSLGLIAGSLQFFTAASELRHVLSAVFRLVFIVMVILFTYKSYMEDHELDLMISESQRRTLKTRVGDVGEKV